MSAQGAVTGVCGMSTEITARKQAEDRLRRKTALTEAANRVLRGALETRTDAELARLCLSGAEALTRSRFGWIGELNASGRLDSHTLSDPGWAACRIPGAGEAMIRDLELRGLYGQVLTGGATLLTNEPDAHPSRVGLPPGHPELTAFLGVPLQHEGRTLGLSALGNAPSGYTALDQEDIESLAVAFVAALQHRRAEAEREQLFRAIEQAAETVVVTDARGTITYVNPTFEAITGYTRAEALGQNPRLLKSGAHDAAFYRAMWDTLTAGRTWHGRLVNRRKDFSHYTEEATLSPVRDAAGTITSYVAVKRDITRDLDLAAQLQQAQRMEGIGRLAGGVTHDFNNLLSVILGNARFGLEWLREAEPLRADLLEIQRASERAATLTRQLLAFSRKQVLEPVPLDLNRVITEMERMLHRIIGEDLDLVLTLAPDLGQILADPGQVEQVIMNLAINAKDAMPGGGTLSLETANVEVDATLAARVEGLAEGPHVRLTIADTGTGMDAATMARLFEPFFTTKGVGKGTGLGLSTIYGIVRQSGGGIAAQSTVGRGSAFSVYLPRQDSVEGRVAKPTPVSLHEVGTETVLLVEDDEGVRHVTRRILRSAGYTVLTAANGGEALLQCEQHTGALHLLLTDVIMPRMSGPELADRLSALRPGLRVLYMSGYTNDALGQHGVLGPGTQLVGKPFTSQDLLRKVREALEASPR